jgi:PIN domain nuclease of toxin-antitoxin system
VGAERSAAQGAQASMRLLLDTHALLWWVFDDRRLSRTARGVIADPGNEILVSSASAWELATKYRLGKLPSAAVLVQDLPGWTARAGFRELPISLAHAQRAGLWPQAHRDPFDRMLAAQSSLEDVALLSSDEALRAFGVQLLW